MAMMSGIVLATIRSGMFITFMLLGVQIPSFVEQYSQRVSARFEEAAKNIGGFQLTADRIFAGDLEALIEYYYSTDDQVFIEGGESIQQILNRHIRLDKELNKLRGNRLQVVIHVALMSDREIFQETLAQYSYNIPLNKEPIVWGLGFGILSMLIIRILAFSLIACHGLVCKTHKFDGTVKACV